MFERLIMDSEEDIIYEEESDEEMSDDDHIHMVMEPEVSSTTRESSDEEFPYTVLEPNMIVEHMIECIGEVNSVFEVTGF